MSDFPDRESKAERDARKERARAVNAGARGADGLTAAERCLIDALRRAGYALSHGWLIDERRGNAYLHNRVVEPLI